MFVIQNTGMYSYVKSKNNTKANADHWHVEAHLKPCKGLEKSINSLGTLLTSAKGKYTVGISKHIL